MSFDKSVVPTKKTAKLYSLPVTLDDWHRALGFHKCATCGAPVGNGIPFAWQGKNRWCEGCFWDEDSANSDELIDLDPLRRRTLMLTREGIEKAIEMYEGSAT